MGGPLKAPRDSRLSQAKEELAGLQDEVRIDQAIIDQMSRRLSDKKARISSLENTIQQLTPRDLRVSDHVLLRYLERAAGLDLEAARKAIVAELAPTAESLGLGTFKAKGYVVKDYTVVTYVGDGN